ncbi:MAG: hypothetical protein JXJ19_05845 [Elusimicrobia bacterium]|nr:hypothetical protein [Elusimicrobiota bacterium]
MILIKPCSADSKISLSFEGVTLGNVLQVLSTKTGRKFITDTDLARMKIVLHLSSVTPEEAVNALLDTYDLYFVRQRDTDIYVIKSKSASKITMVSKIFYCNHASAEELETVLATKLNEGGNISHDARTNALIVTDMADNIEKIGMLIEELDTPTQQVLIEAKILDVKIDSELKMGMDITDLKYIKDPEYVYNQQMTPGLSGNYSKLNVGIIEKNYSINAVIEALQSKTDAKILNNPKLLVLNNREATIDIIDEIPYQERTETEEGGLLTSTEFKEVGVKIIVKPQINKNGNIIIDITPEQSFLTGSSVNNIPIINTSKVQTSFMLKDGETAVIGGLVRETNSNSAYKVPILGDIPLVGYFFKRTDKKTTRSELAIFVTAKVVENIEIDK